MKYTLALSLLLAALPALAKGATDKDKKVQPGREPDPKEMAGKMTEHMSQGLDLNADQKKKVEGIIAESMPQRMELEKKVHKLEWDTDEKIRAVLTDEQKEKFDHWRLMKGHHPGMGRNGPPLGGRPGMAPGGPAKGGPAGQAGPEEGPKDGEGAPPAPPGDGPREDDGGGQ